MPDEKLPRGGAEESGSAREWMGWNRQAAYRVSDTAVAVVPRATCACWLDSVFMTDTCRFGSACSATTMELLQQVLTGATITVSQQTVSRTGSQQTGW